MSTRKSKPIKRNPVNFNARDLHEYVMQEAERTGKSKDEILEETFHDGYVVISESGDGAFKVEGGQLFKPQSERIDDLTECRRLRERFGPIASCVDYIKDLIMGSGLDVMVDDINDDHQQKVKGEIMKWMKLIYQDVYTVGLNALLDILVDNALTDGFAAAEIVYSGEDGDLFQKYAKLLTSSVISQESGKLAKSDYSSYDIKEPVWSDLKGIARMKIFMDAPTRLRLFRRGNTWEAEYWVLDQPNIVGSQGGMTSATQKNLQMSTSSQLTAEDLIRSTLPAGSRKSPIIAKPSAYFLPWQIFSLSLTRRSWLEKGPSIILPALKTAQLLEKIMNAVGEGIYRAGNKKYFIICGTKDRPWGAIHIRNLLSQLKDASEKNWSTIPVPAGFDLKEAGGTVFEAQNAINYFLRVIAGIMHVNPSVLGLDTREARNVTEVPYFTHLRMKEEFRSQIQTQLVRLHIWATYGQKKQKQGGYDEPQWIPELRIKTEDLLNPSDRLKLDIDILNAANPVLPQTKLEVERDIIETRGWEVDLPTQQEFMKDLKEQQAKDKAFKEQQQELALQNGKAQVQASKEKGMGSPEPPSEEKQQKRLDKGVSTHKTDAGGKSNKPRGSTRTPAEVQESLLTTDLIIEESSGKKSIYNPLTGEKIQIIEWELTGGIAGYSKDQSSIYVDPLVPSWMYVPLFAHEIFEMACVEDLGLSYKWAHEKATGVEKTVAEKHEINWEKYDAEYKRLLDLQEKRSPQPKQPKDIHKGFMKGRKTKKVEESKQESKQEPQKVDVNIHIDQPQKTEHEVTIKTEPLKTERQEIDLNLHQDITLQEDPEKKKAEEELRKQKKDILDKMKEKLEKDE